MSLAVAVVASSSVFPPAFAAEHVGGAASSGFGAVRTIAASGIPSYGLTPAVAVNARGQSVIAWLASASHGVRLMVRRGDRLGRFAPAQSIDVGTLTEPSVSIAPDGTAAVIWSEGLRGRTVLRVAVARAGARFARSQTLVTSVDANVSGVQVVASARRVVAVWSQLVLGLGGADIRYAIADATGRFGAAKALAVPVLPLEVSAGVDPAGDVVAAFAPITASGAPGALVSAVLRVGAHGFTAPQTIPDASAKQSFPGTARLFAGPGGFAAAYVLPGDPLLRLQVAMLKPDATFAPAQTVGQVAVLPPHVVGLGFAGPVVALPASGGAIAAWTALSARAQAPATRPTVRPLMADHGELDAALQQPNGSFSAPIQLTAPSTLSQNLAAAATRDLAILVWTEGPYNHEQLRYTTRTATRALSSPRTLDSAANQGAALAAAGTHAIVTWTSHHTLHAALLSG